MHYLKIEASGENQDEGERETGILLCPGSAVLKALKAVKDQLGADFGGHWTVQAPDRDLKSWDSTGLSPRDGGVRARG